MVTLIFYIFAGSIFPLYFFMGYAIHSEKLKIGRILSVIFILIGAAGMIFLTYYRLHTADADTAKRVEKYRRSVLCSTHRACAAGVFSLFKSFDNGKEIPFLDKAAAEIDKCSFGIYLIHMIVYKHIFVVYEVLTLCTRQHRYADSDDAHSFCSVLCDNKSTEICTVSKRNNITQNGG
ncbi:hypothetical protein [Ruminococcus albus]|uniref:hypothetical protein n=1 Tax=Ruminococcus albus TaxID=1264 RepID=UPI000462F8B7|nr:hypothetical protein [Ruminococcus albus]